MIARSAFGPWPVWSAKKPGVAPVRARTGTSAIAQFAQSVVVGRPHASSSGNAAGHRFGEQTQASSGSANRARGTGGPCRRPPSDPAERRRSSTGSATRRRAGYSRRDDPAWDGPRSACRPAGGQRTSSPLSTQARRRRRGAVPGYLKETDRPADFVQFRAHDVGVGGDVDDRNVRHSDALRGCVILFP